MHSGSFSSIEEFVSKPIKGSKRFRRILHRPNYSFLPDPWQKALNDFLIQKDLIKKSLTYGNSKIISPKLHDRKQRLLQRKTQFRDQLSKHKDIPDYCEWCKDNLGLEIKETFLHGTYSCSKLYDGPDIVLQHLGMSHLLTEAVSATDLIFYSQTGDIALDTVLSAIFTIYLYYVHLSRDTNSQLSSSAPASSSSFNLSKWGQS